MLSDFVRSQPGFFDVGPADAPEATEVGPGIWCSPGLSSAYLITSDDGRAVVNTGMWFESPVHQRNFDAVSDAPVRYVILTQGHTDHIGGVGLFREDGTELVAHADSLACQADDHRIHGFRIRRSLPFFAAVMGQPDYVRGGPVDVPPEPSWATPDVTFRDELTLMLGTRRLELLSLPGGETIDSSAVWLPEDGVALVGNVFSALFGHVPNLVTMRGDRLRFALPFIESVQRVIDLEPEALLLGHHGPLRGAGSVRAELTRVRDAVQWLHDATLDAMNRGDDVFTAMRSITLPDELEAGQGYGRVDWDVRAIWEGYGGWFHQRSTLELYPDGPEAGWADAVDLAGGPDAVAARAAVALDDDRPVDAVRLCEMALSVDDAHAGALTTYRDAHRLLLDQHRTQAEPLPNFWLTRWLEGEITSAGNRLGRPDPA